MPRSRQLGEWGPLRQATRARSSIARPQSSPRSTTGVPSGQGCASWTKAPPVERSVSWAGIARLCASTSQAIAQGTRVSSRCSSGSVSESSMLTAKRSSKGENGSQSAQRSPSPCSASASGSARRGPTGSTQRGASLSGSTTRLRTAGHESVACAPDTSSAPSCPRRSAASITSSSRSSECAPARPGTSTPVRVGGRSHRGSTPIVGRRAPPPAVVRRCAP